MTRKGGVDLASCTAGCIGASDHACWMLSVTCLWHAVGFILSCCKQSAWVFLPHPGWQSYRELSLPLHFRPYKSQGFWLVRRSSCTHPLSQFMGLEWVIVASWAGHTFTLCWMEGCMGLTALSADCGIYSGRRAIVQGRENGGKRAIESNLCNPPHTVYLKLRSVGPHRHLTIFWLCYLCLDSHCSLLHFIQL